MKIDFRCGCFLSFWIDQNKIKSALSCCSEHEFPYASPSFFTLQIDECKCSRNDYQTKEFLKAGYHGMCKWCDKPVITTTELANKLTHET